MTHFCVCVKCVSSETYHIIKVLWYQDEKGYWKSYVFPVNK